MNTQKLRSSSTMLIISRSLGFFAGFILGFIPFGGDNRPGHFLMNLLLGIGASLFIGLPSTFVLWLSSKSLEKIFKNNYRERIAYLNSKLIRAFRSFNYYFLFSCILFFIIRIVMIGGQVLLILSL